MAQKDDRGYVGQNRTAPNASLKRINFRVIDIIARKLEKL